MSASFLMLAVVALLPVGCSCRPIVPTPSESSLTSPSQSATQTDSDVTAPTTETGSPSSTEATSSSTESSPSTSAWPTDPATTASESDSTQTGPTSETGSVTTWTTTGQTTGSLTGSTGTSAETTRATTHWPYTTTTQPSYSTTQPPYATTQPPYTTTTQLPYTTTTQPPYTTTKQPVYTTTTAAPTTKAATTVQTTTTAAAPDSSFPVRNYGTFFRDEYGTNANIVSGYEGGLLIDIGSAPEGVALVKVISISTAKICKAVVKGPDGRAYQYTIASRNRFEGLPLQMGNGKYTITLYEQVSGTSYVTRMAHTFSVTLGSSLRPFTASSIIVNFSKSSSSTSRASSLVSGKANQAARIEAVYLWIVNNINYDRALAASITSGELKTYIPSPDRTMSTRTGICYDYAALMAAMLRSQGIPTRLIMGQVPQGYHAWNEVYIQGTGWVVIASFKYWQVDGSAWILFDSTFAAGGMSSQTILNTTHTKERTY